jgi:hypothetical protein
MFDNDQNKKNEKQKPHTSVLLQKLCKVEKPEEWPDGVFDRFCAMPGNLEDYLTSVMGADYEVLMKEVADEYKLSVEDIKKTPAAVSAVMTTAALKGHKFSRFHEIIQKVDELSVLL